MEKGMVLSDRLDGLRRDVAGCEFVSYGDLAKGQVLRTSASKEHDQAYVDALMQQAAQNFAMSDQGGAGHDRIVVATQDELRVFVRSAPKGADVICCVCDDIASLSPAVKAARMLLREMTRGV